MRSIFCTLLLIFLSGFAYGQLPETPAVIMTPEDIEISFPTASDSSWFAPTVVSIAYSSEALREASYHAKLGEMTWESEMWDSTQADFRKAISVIKISSIPSPKDRRMLCRVRNRYEGCTSADGIGPYSETGYVDIIGPPKAPIKVGFDPAMKTFDIEICAFCAAPWVRSNPVGRGNGLSSVG